jgi:hypothetical protein
MRTSTSRVGERGAALEGEALEPGLLRARIGKTRDLLEPTPSRRSEHRGDIGRIQRAA